MYRHVFIMIFGSDLIPGTLGQPSSVQPTRLQGIFFIEHEIVASMITGLKPCRLLSMVLSIDIGVLPSAENIERFNGKHRERN